MIKLRSAKALALFLGLLLLGACSNSGAMEVGKKAVEFTLYDINGGRVSLSEYNGKVVILNFFAGWCPPCRQEIPDFIELVEQYSPEGFMIIGITNESRDEAGSFAERVGINYPVLIDDGNVSAVYGPIRSIPTTFIIDREGKIAKIYIGARPKDVFENDIKELL